jgi:putative ATP-dependent endonuclease of the OLD family
VAAELGAWCYSAFSERLLEEALRTQDTGVIYAVEEPETSQHPNHQIMMLEAFEELVEQGRCQVILTTHTPTLARRVNRNALRLIEMTEHG